MLSERTIEIFGNNEMKAYDRDKNSNGEYTRDIEFFSPEGEDVIECIWYDGTDEGFIKAFRENAEHFDPDEHAEMWVESRGTRGVPESIKDLIADAEWIKNTLLAVADELEAEETTEGNNDGFQAFKQLILNKCKVWEINTEDIYFNQTRDNYYADYKPKYPNKSGADFTVVKDIWKNTIQIYGNFDALIPTIKPLETYGKRQ